MRRDRVQKPALTEREEGLKRYVDSWWEKSAWAQSCWETKDAAFKAVLKSFRDGQR